MREPRPVREGREKAEAVRFQHNLGDAPIRDLFGFIEKHYPEVLVVRRPSPDGPEGALLRIDDGWIMFVNSAGQILARQRFTAAHELGHYLFDSEERHSRIDHKVLDGGSGLEMRANAFAVHFLLPASALRSRTEPSSFDWNNEEAVVALAMEFGLSLQSLSWHMKNILDLSEAQRRRIAEIDRPFGIAARLGLGDRVRQEMEAKDAVRWPRRYMALAARAFAMGKLSKSELARLIQDEDLVEDVVEAESLR